MVTATEEDTTIRITRREAEGKADGLRNQLRDPNTQGDLAEMFRRLRRYDRLAQGLPVSGFEVVSKPQKAS